MKNHELLDMIGDVNEDYVLEAGNNVVKPRFRWKTLAACAACAALVLGAYPVYRAAHPPLHSYTVLEGSAMNTLDDVKLPAGGKTDPSAVPGGAIAGGDKGQTGLDGTEYTVPGGAYIGDAPAQEHASDQYDKLLKGMGMFGENAADRYPGWFAGAWIDGETLHVALVGGERDAALEEQIQGWCGDDVVFEYARYSHAYLDGLMEPVTALLDGTGLNCGIGVDVTANCLGVDLYSNGQAIPDSILAELAKLDPAGDAIRVRLFTGKLDTLTDDMVKGPAPVSPEERAAPVEEPAPVKDGEPVPGGVTTPAVGELPQSKGEDIQPARYDLLPLGE